MTGEDLLKAQVLAMTGEDLLKAQVHGGPK